MSIQLPDASDVSRAIELWQADDPRLTQLLTRYPDPAPALRHFGLVLWQEAQLERASQAFIGSLALKPDDARAWNDLSGVFVASGRTIDAAACIEEALKHEPTAASAWLRLGTIRNDLGQADKAIEAFTAAVERDHSLVQGWLGLGLLHLRAKRYVDAIAALREAVARSEMDAAAHVCLGEAFYASGHFAEAADSFGVAATLQPDNPTFRFKAMQARFVADLISGDVEDAITVLERSPASDVERQKIIRDGFHLLSGFGHHEAAIRLGELRLAGATDDAVQSYLLAALKGEHLPRAPDTYIVRYFDEFADTFDRKLVDVLAYTTPNDLAGMIDRRHRAPGRVLDLGCGTGLAGPHLAAAGRTVTGVDLSPRMLAKARERGCYDHLVESEILAFLSSATPASYELVMTADVLVYFGDLAALFAAVARVLTSGGLWALSIETTDDVDVRLLPSGRFAHRTSYVTRLARDAGMEILEMVATTIRLEANRPAIGALILLGTL